MSTTKHSYILPGHRGGQCRQCEGDGYEESCERHGGCGFGVYEPQPGHCDECEPCHDCDGHGTLAWEWRERDRGPCDQCDRDDVAVDLWGEDEDLGVCRSCALRIHEQECGCDKWPSPFAREEAARVLAFVAQLAALLQGQRLAGPWKTTAGSCPGQKVGGS